MQRGCRTRMLVGRCTQGHGWLGDVITNGITYKYKQTRPDLTKPIEKPSPIARIVYPHISDLLTLNVIRVNVDGCYDSTYDNVCLLTCPVHVSVTWHGWMAGLDDISTSNHCTDHLTYRTLSQDSWRLSHCSSSVSPGLWLVFCLFRRWGHHLMLMLVNTN